jgi:hypothetical protein
MAGYAGETEQGTGGVPIVHGFPHLETVRTALTALHRRLSADGVRRFAASVHPELAAFPADEDLYLGTQRIARAMVQHLRLPDARMVVSFRDMVHAGNVELAAGPEYFIELHARFKADRRDVGAALAHEVMHVYLHRLGLSLPGTRDNEILTDTAAAYLGAGWLLLDAYREDAAVVGDRVTRAAYKLGYPRRRSSGTSWPSGPRCSGRTPSRGSAPRRRSRPTGRGGRGTSRTCAPRRSPPRAGRRGAATGGTAGRWPRGRGTPSPRARRA